MKLKVFNSTKTGRKCFAIGIEGITKLHLVCFETAVICDIMDLTPSQLMAYDVGEYTINI